MLERPRCKEVREAIKLIKQVTALTQGLSISSLDEKQIEISNRLLLDSRETYAED